MRYYHIGMAVPVNYFNYQVGGSDGWWYESLSKMSNTPLTETIFFHNKMKAEIDKIDNLISRSKTPQETRDLLKRRDELVAIRDKVRAELDRKHLSTRGPMEIGPSSGLAFVALAILALSVPAVLIIAGL